MQTEYLFKKPSALGDRTQPKQILLSELRDPEKGHVIGERHTTFKPGMIIERCGRKYSVDKNGVQHRLRVRGMK